MELLQLSGRLNCALVLANIVTLTVTANSLCFSLEKQDWFRPVLSIVQGVLALDNQSIVLSKFNNISIKFCLKMGP